MRGPDRVSCWLRRDSEVLEVGQCDGSRPPSEGSVADYQQYPGKLGRRRLSCPSEKVQPPLAVRIKSLRRELRDTRNSCRRDGLDRPLTCRLTLRPSISVSTACMTAGDGRTIGPRIRISRPDGGNARCNASRAPAQPRNSFQRTQPSTTPSMSNAISRQPRRNACIALRR